MCGVTPYVYQARQTTAYLDRPVGVLGCTCLKHSGSFCENMSNTRDMTSFIWVGDSTGCSTAWSFSVFCVMPFIGFDGIVTLAPS